MVREGRFVGCLWVSMGGLIRGMMIEGFNGVNKGRGKVREEKGRGKGSVSQ